MAVDTQNQSELHKARKNQLDKSSEYIKRFLATVNQSSDFEVAHCPTCGYIPDEPLFSKNNGEYCYCPSCDHIFLKNPLKLDKLIEFYSGYPTSSLEWHHNESEFYSKIYHKGLSVLNLSRNSTLLDIGCSSGYFLSIAQENALNCFGIEPNKIEAEYAIAHGINILGPSIESITHQTFDAITLWDVLEHIGDPVAYLQHLRQLLNPGGLLFVQVPTSDSLAAKIMRESCNMFDGIEHLTLFSGKSLDLAMKSAGLSLVRKEYIISDSFAINNYLSYEVDPYLPQRDHPPHQLDFICKDSLFEQGMGYKIQAVYEALS